MEFSQYTSAFEEMTNFMNRTQPKKVDNSKKRQQAQILNKIKICFNEFIVFYIDSVKLREAIDRQHRNIQTLRIAIPRIKNQIQQIQKKIVEQGKVQKDNQGERVKQVSEYKEAKKRYVVLVSLGNSIYINHTQQRPTEKQIRHRSSRVSSWSENINVKAQKVLKTPPQYPQPAQKTQQLAQICQIFQTAASLQEHLSVQQVHKQFQHQLTQFQKRKTLNFPTTSQFKRQTESVTQDSQPFEIFDTACIETFHQLEDDKVKFRQLPSQTVYQLIKERNKLFELHSLLEIQKRPFVVYNSRKRNQKLRL